MKIILNIKTLFLLFSVIVVLSLLGCSPKVQKEEANVFELEKKSIKKIFLCTAGDNDDVLKIDYIWQVENIEDISCIVDALQKPEKIKTSMWSLSKMVFISKDGSAQWIYFNTDYEDKEAFGTHWRSRELWDFLMKKGMIGSAKKTSLSQKDKEPGSMYQRMEEQSREMEKHKQKMMEKVRELEKAKQKMNK